MPKMTVFDGINAKVPEKPKPSTPTSLSRSDASRNSDDVPIASLAKQNVVKKSTVFLSAEEKEAFAAEKNLKATISSLMKKKLVEKPLFDPLLVNFAPPRLVLATWDRFIFHTYHPRRFQFCSDIYLSKLSPFASVAEEMETVDACGVCATCGSGNNLLPCSRCPLGFHKRCVDPHNKIPLLNGKWYCPACYHAIIHEQKNDPAPPEFVPGETGAQALRRLAQYASEGNPVDNVLMPSLFHMYRQRAKADWIRCILCNKITFVSDGAIAEALPVPFRCEYAFWDPNAHKQCEAVMTNNGVNGSVSGMIDESPVMKRVVRYLSGNTRRRSRMKWFRELGEPGEEWINYPKLRPLPPKLPTPPLPSLPTPPPQRSQPPRPPPTLSRNTQPVAQKIVTSQPVAQKPVVQKLIVQKPIVQKPVVQKPVAQKLGKGAVSILPKVVLPPVHLIPIYPSGITEKISVSDVLPPQPTPVNKPIVPMPQAPLHPIPSAPVERVSTMRIDTAPSQSTSLKRATVSVSQTISQRVPSSPVERKSVGKTPRLQPATFKKTNTVSARPVALKSTQNMSVERGKAGKATPPHPSHAKRASVSASQLPTHADLTRQALERASVNSAAAAPLPTPVKRASISGSRAPSPEVPSRPVERISVSSNPIPAEVVTVKRASVSASQAPSNGVSDKPTEGPGVISNSQPQPAPMRRTTMSASQVVSNVVPSRVEGVIAMSQGSVANSTCDVKNPQSTEDLQSKVMEYVSGLEIDEWIEDVLTDLAMESNFKLFKLYTVFHKKKDKFIRHATRLAKSQKLD